MAQLEQNLSMADSFTPLTDEERLSFFKDIMPLLRPGQIRWRTTHWDCPNQ
jgi:hypothetical protein